MTPPQTKAEARVARLNREVPKLMGVREVAELLGVETSNLDRVAGLPPHATRLSRGRVWRADLIREFARKRRRRTG